MVRVRLRQTGKSMTKSSVITLINDHNGRTDNLLFSALPKIDVFTLNLLDNGLSARYLLNEWMDFDQACTAVLLRQRQEQIRFFFFTLIPFSRLHKGYDFRKWLVSTLSH